LFALQSKVSEYFMSTYRPSHDALRLVTLLWLTLITVDLAQGQSLAGKELIAALRSGGYVILMRHASSPRNPPEAAQADVENVQRERQLDEEGRASARASWLKAKASALPGPHENMLIVTHFPNISEAYPDHATGLTDGEALILHPDGRGGAAVVARVKIDEWATLATAR
jgi:hypothetical protein